MARLERGAAAADRAVARIATLTTPDGATLGPLWTGAPLRAPRRLDLAPPRAAAAPRRRRAPPAAARAVTTGSHGGRVVVELSSV